jgi:hypothetical protein
MRVSENLSILFLLEKSEMDNGGRAPIYVRLTGNGPRREMSLGIKVFPEKWNQQLGMIAGSGAEIARMNKLISKTKAKLEQIELVLSAQHEFVSPEMIKKVYKESTAEKNVESEKPKQKTLCQTCNYKYSKFAVLVKAAERSENTLKRWRTTKRKIREFLKYKFKKRDVPLSAIKYSHANDFLHFLLTKQGIEENTCWKDSITYAIFFCLPALPVMLFRKC